MRDIEVREEPVVGEMMKTIGVDWGPNGIVLVHREGDYGVYKIPGHMAWTSNFSPWNYEATKYGIVRLYKHSDVLNSGFWGSIDLVHRTEIAPGGKWRHALKRLKAEARQWNHVPGLEAESGN